jgi:uncharacterized membrane protein
MEGECPPYGFDEHLLFILAYQVAFHSTVKHVVRAKVPKASQVKLSAQFAVDTSQQVEIELGRNTTGIVIGCEQKLDVLAQIKADNDVVAVI